MSAITDSASAAAALTGNATLGDDSLTFALGECTLRLRSNSTGLIEVLHRYFAHVLARPGPHRPDIEVIAIESPPADPGVAFIDWKREPGKTGRKDAYYDLPDGRLILKVRTGMVFLQSEAHRVAAGPCLEFDNQVINFVNAQYMNWLQHRDWLICHAAGLAVHGMTIGIAGFSGGGKSTLMLRLLDNGGVSYLTNDRLFIRRTADSVEAVGIPKLPRVNPGTIVHNPRLQDLIPGEKRKALLALPPRELWDLEEKYDVDVADVYGPERITPRAPLAAFVVLNWRRDLDETPRLERVDPERRRDLLGAIMKSPGPFYQYPDGTFYRDDTPLDETAYLRVLGDLPVYEVGGGISFDVLVGGCLDLIGKETGRA